MIEWIADGLGNHRLSLAGGLVGILVQDAGQARGFDVYVNKLLVRTASGKATVEDAKIEAIDFVADRIVLLSQQIAEHQAARTTPVVLRPVEVSHA